MRFAGMGFLMILAAGTVLAGEVNLEAGSEGHLRILRGSTEQRQPDGPVCWYNNRQYSEGAVLKSGGSRLRCGRDRRVLGTSPLIWLPADREARGNVSVGD